MIKDIHVEACPVGWWVSVRYSGGRWEHRIVRGGCTVWEAVAPIVKGHRLGLMLWFKLSKFQNKEEEKL